jgi:choline monooxygenase
MIVVNISNNEVPFEQYIKPLSDRWNKFWPEKDQKLIKHPKDLGYFQLKAKCNWKFAIENYCESYHLPWVHPELNEYSKLDDHYHIQGLPNRFAVKELLFINLNLKVKKNFHVFRIGQKIK